MKKYDGKLTSINRIMLCCLLALTLVSCATGHYKLDVRYMPQTESTKAADSGMQQCIITTAQFNDERNEPDREFIGKRIHGDSSVRKAVPLTLTPSETVGTAIKDAFFKNGYTVFGGTPAWDCTGTSVREEWGNLVVGGFIEELDVTSRTDFLSAEYKTKVKLRVIFADVKQKSILYTTSIESSSSFSHLFFNQSRMEQEINNTLSSAVEKMFTDNKVKEIINSMTHK